MLLHIFPLPHMSRLGILHSMMHHPPIFSLRPPGRSCDNRTPQQPTNESQRQTTKTLKLTFYEICFCNSFFRYTFTLDMFHLNSASDIYLGETECGYFAKRSFLFQIRYFSIHLYSGSTTNFLFKNDLSNFQEPIESVEPF